MIIVLLHLPKNSTLIQVFRCFLRSLDLLLLKLLTAFNVDRDEMG